MTKAFQNHIAARLVMSLKPRAHVQLHSKMSADQKFNHLWEPLGLVNNVRPQIGIAK